MRTDKQRSFKLRTGESQWRTRGPHDSPASCLRKGLGSAVKRPNERSRIVHGRSVLRYCELDCNSEIEDWTYDGIVSNIQLL